MKKKAIVFVFIEEEGFPEIISSINIYIYIYIVVVVVVVVPGKWFVVS